jgi:hypothetical protein
MFEKSYSFAAFHHCYYKKTVITSILIQKNLSSLSHFSISEHVIGQIDSRGVRKRERERERQLLLRRVAFKKKRTFFAFFFFVSIFLPFFFIMPFCQCSVHLFSHTHTFTNIVFRLPFLNKLSIYISFFK